MNSLYKSIVSLKSFYPSPKVNFLFGELVKCALSDNDLGLSPAQKAKIQLKCSNAEYELEKHWAKRIISSKKPKQEIKNFPYYENYEKLTKLEWFSLLSCSTHKKHNIVFIGGGPLPLTAIILAEKYKCKVTVLDVDDEACELSLKIVKKLGLCKNLEILKKDGASFENYKNYNAVIVAALAGLEFKSKEKILKKIKEDAKPKTHILARSSWGAREILYKPLDSNVYKIFKPVLEVYPVSDIINSVVIFEN